MKVHTLFLMVFLTGLALAEPNIPAKDPAIEIAELKVIIKKHEKTIRLARRKVTELKKENKHLLRLCRQAGIDTRPKRGEHFALPIKLGIKGKPLGFTNIAVGEVGWVHTVTVKQIIDDTNAIVSIALVDKHGYLLWNGYDYINRTVWLTGISTERHADDTGIELTCLCTIIGTKNYTTVLGAKRTLYVMEPIAKDDWFETELMRKDKKAKSKQ